VNFLIFFLHPKLRDILKPKVNFLFMKVHKESSMVCMKDFFEKINKFVIFEREFFFDIFKISKYVLGVKISTLGGRL